MEKECVFLSQSNFGLMYELRRVSKTYGIELSPCREITEMIDMYNKGTNAVLVEGFNLFDVLNEYLDSGLLKKIYYLQDNAVYDNNKALVFKSYDDFFNSNLFVYKISKKQSENYEMVVSDKFSELGIVINSWVARFIKYILCEMRERNQSYATKELIESVAARKEVNCKYLYDAIRPTLKSYEKLLIKDKENTSNKIKIILNKLYEYCFLK